jgi:OmpR-family two-component system manganese-sensing sensor histidine kinase
MALVSKQFGEWVTALEHKLFKTARLKLTAFYIIMSALILCVFSFILYFSLAKNLREDLAGEVSVSKIQRQAVESTLDNTKNTIVVIDIGILVLVSFAAYVSSGKTLKPIEQALEAQKQFSADASHEFRTPLSIIKHDIEIALKNSRLDDKETRIMLQSNLEEVNHMSTIVDQLLKLSRSDSGVVKKNHFLVDLSGLVKMLVEKMQKLAKYKNIELSLAKVESGWVIGDSAAIEEVVGNLLQNALDYTPPGGKVYVSIKSAKKHMEIVIKDTGIGIEAKDLPHLFKRFYKADNARTLRSNSSGLGLSIAYDIVKQHKGTIVINSVPAEGTTVTVSLPTLLT